MGEDELAEILKYSSSKELYIVSWNNVLKLIICPFKVIVLLNIGTLKCGQKIMVDEVKVTYELKTVYIINDTPYFYNYFDILLD
jgi:hypothetical protein